MITEENNTPEQPADPKEREIMRAAQQLLAVLHANRPPDRSDLSRRHAIAITEAEKLYAWIETWL